MSTGDAATTATTATAPPPGRRLGRAGAVVLGLGALAGLAVYVVGLPSSLVLFGTPADTLSLPAALFVAFTTATVVGAAVAHAPWRVVDIVVASVLGVASGLVFIPWNVAWNALALTPPASSLLVGVWLVPAVLGGLVLRKPGAAVYTELVAAVVSAFGPGNAWGFSTVWYGLVEGLGAEVVLALLLYRRFGATVALTAGAGAGVTVGLMDSLLYYTELSSSFRALYVAGAVVSGAVLAGLGGWALTRSLAATGVLAPLASGRGAERV